MGFFLKIHKKENGTFINSYSNECRCLYFILNTCIAYSNVTRSRLSQLLIIVSLTIVILPCSKLWYAPVLFNHLTLNGSFLDLKYIFQDHGCSISFIQINLYPHMLLLGKRLIWIVLFDSLLKPSFQSHIFLPTNQLP